MRRATYEGHPMRSILARLAIPARLAAPLLCAAFLAQAPAMAAAGAAAEPRPGEVTVQSPDGKLRAELSNAGGTCAIASCSTASSCSPRPGSASALTASSLTRM